MTPFERIVGAAGGLIVIALVASGAGDSILVAFAPFLLLVTGSIWWRERCARR